jgi:hypothetical protein
MSEKENVPYFPAPNSSAIPKICDSHRLAQRVTIPAIGISVPARQRGTRRREADMDVDALSIAALLALAAAWGWLIVARRRAAQRAAEARARSRARRRRIPAVSANVRGLSGPPPDRQDDLWVRETEGTSHDRRAS